MYKHQIGSGSRSAQSDGTTQNALWYGDSIQLLKQRVADNSIDLVVTDPPYLVNYHDRNGRKIINDNQPNWIEPVYKEIYRTLKTNSVCISFYGWNQVDLFMTAWKKAGFRPVAHIVWHKPYTSGTGLLERRHESAYVLAKGSNIQAQKLLKDVQPWIYSGNKLHPTHKPVSAIQTLIEAFSKPGDLVLDPFAGSATTAIAAAQSKRRYLMIEKDYEYFKIASQRLKTFHQVKQVI